MKYALLSLPRECDQVSAYTRSFSAVFQHPFYGWLGLRPALAQHTAAEHRALQRWAAGRMSIVELGVAEGVSALAMREVMGQNACLYLVDPFHLSRIPVLNFVKRVAHKAVGSCRRGKVFWIPKFSHDALSGWDSRSICSSSTVTTRSLRSNATGTIGVRLYRQAESRFFTMRECSKADG